MRQQTIDVMLAGGHPARMGCTTLADTERAQICAPRLGAPPASPVSTTAPPAAHGTPPDTRAPCPEPPVDACPRCRCTRLIVMGAYRKCQLCVWAGKADGLLRSMAPSTR